MKKVNDKANNDSILNLVLRLVIITVCAGLILGLVYVVTKEPIEQQNIKKATEARQAVLPSAQDFKQVALDGIDYDHENTERYRKYTRERRMSSAVGHTYSIVTKGYKAGLTLTVRIASDGRVTGVEITAHDETPGLGANATDPGGSNNSREQTGRWWWQNRPPAR